MPSILMIINVISITTCVAAVLLLYLIYRKIEAPLFKYAFYIRVLPTVMLIINFVLLNLLFESNFSEPVLLALGILIYLSSITNFILGIFFLHKIIQRPIPLFAKIGMVGMAGILTVSMIMNFTPEKIMDFTIPLLFGKLEIIYWIYQIKKNITRVTIEPLKIFLSLTINISIIGSVISIITVFVYHFLPDFFFIFKILDMNAIMNGAFSASIIIFIGKYFFQPVSAKKERPLTQDTAQSLKLTRREKQLTELLIQGLSVQEMSEQLLISNQTIKNYTHNLYRKLNIKNKIELIHLVQEKTMF